MPFELRDIAMLKLFFADALEATEAHHLLAQVITRSEERVATLETIRPVAEAAVREGDAYPLLTLELGIAVHQAMVEVCQRFQGTGTGSRSPA
jgi:hypothetical protein